MSWFKILLALNDLNLVMNEKSLRTQINLRINHIKYLRTHLARFPISQRKRDERNFEHFSIMEITCCCFPPPHCRCLIKMINFRLRRHKRIFFIFFIISCCAACICVKKSAKIHHLELNRLR